MHEELSLPLAATALLLVDFQEEHRRDTRYLASRYEVALANGRRLLEAARAAGIAVMHAEYVRDFARVPPRPFEILGPEGEPGFSDAAGGLVAICPEVAPGAGEPVFTKNDASAFADTELARALTARGIAWLIVAGAWTEACVAATVRDGIAAGFRVLLVKDACASGTEMMHETAVLDLANRLTGGGVAATEAALALVAGQAATVWRLRTMVPFRYDADTYRALYAAL